MTPERALLERLLAGPVSGDALARASGQTRAAVWKRIEALRAAGVAIEARRGRGYALAQPLELLDPERIRAALPEDVGAAVVALEVAWSLDSTSSELLRRDTPQGGVAVLMAERQSDGRGRRGRGWASPLVANLYLSLSRRFAGGLARLGGLGVVAGVAAAEALHELGAGAVRLKWPNDLVVVDADGRLHKLGGLLVEGSGEHAGPARAVLGLGLNLRMPSAAAAAIDQPWTDLGTVLGRVASRNLVAARLVAALVPALALFDREGLAPFLPRFAALDALAGRPVRVEIAGAGHDGIALGAAADGALRVRTGDRERTFHAGEVSVRAGAGR
ncbi:bifunctional biotin--[acetyl-CoA-carboxylase] ligase/biotin operon repressor BirA [Luteimonas sp. SJ-92]|uniref:Bifunctional ligase/repressor BirA n=1 Tax=Luteimonas salinisoli TaxID=2752307 RepID=A0A853J8C6_9GAMM|nr:bifunctional biotin--[acetyl-CoA-carboxylase] ligase/biotin operon repressor BirA [Luteimonas salinisoli]NZA25391.1 bifunctional biotin--[acetyl-CoA-carboxylase] ligase/biotin operon repressor BirA [Luteimonas salinisoli]